MKKEYASPKAEKMEFNYEETVVASDAIICGSGLQKIYTDTGKLMCTDTYVGTTEVWKADNL